MGRFDGQIAVITGGARGIGAATATRFASEGATVAVVDLSEQDAAAAAAALPGGASHLGIAADVGDADSARAAVEQAIDRLGRIDVLMNNAGVTRDNLLFKMSDDDWDTVIRVHLTGSFLMSRAAQAQLVAQRYGRIINVSSISALGNRGQANYAAAKMGIQGFTRTLALELGKFGVTVNAIAPGFIVSDMTSATAERLRIGFEEFKERTAAATAIGRIGQPQDIAGVAAFLASEDASYLTGQTIYVDGGQTLG
ncbi:MAG TPA: 3-oxoacyl-ACP reductase FabG [Solirubrobacteraceae bacterium]|jgi:3-oxoacyl-[acyl-carrier protein] reductase|nr:3-oxoacyl-ACP reductase FabG [Solirubrobacteraceae bacterium]